MVTSVANSGSSIAGNARSVAALCEHLEGIPLALELAAARSAVMTPAQMLKRVAGRLDFLASRRPVSWTTVRRWRRVGRTWPAFPLRQPA